MKKESLNFYVAILILVAVIFSFLTLYAFGDYRGSKISVSGRSAALYQPETNNFLYLKNADEKLPMASTTKIMTALIALERCNFDDTVAIHDNAIGTEGSSAYLKSGEILTIDELVHAVLLQSANDAAVALAYHISGSVEDFANEMNTYAEDIGLKNTHFVNPHGLDDENHYTTAADLAILTAHALKNENFKKTVSTYKASFTNGERVRNYVNHNKLLKLYDGCIGVKTGYTKRSGRCLVAAAERDGLTFISVTLDAPSDWQDHRVMLDYGFDTLQKLVLTEAYHYNYTLPVIGGEKDSIQVTNTQVATIITDKGAQTPEEHTRLNRYVIAPINKGDRLGEIIYTINGKEVARVELIATESIKTKQSIIKKILSIFD